MLMEEILHQLIGSLFHYFQVLYIPGGERRISEFLPQKTHRLDSFLWPGTAIAIGGVLLYSLTKERDRSVDGAKLLLTWLTGKKTIFNRTYIDSFITGFSSQPLSS